MIYRIAEDVFGLAQWSFVEDYFIPFFSPMRYASAKSLAMKAPFNNKLPTQTNDVIINPENPVNPDSKIGCCARNFHRRMGELLVLRECFP